jgi:hypothetical protein
MMASGENHLSSTTMRRMPVLAQSTSANPIDKVIDAICSAPAITFGAQIQLNYGFLNIFGGEGQASLSVTSHGQVIWTQTGGGVLGWNSGLILSGALQSGFSRIDPTPGFSSISTLGGEAIATAGEGFAVGASAATDGSGLAVNALGRGGFATGLGFVAGVDYQHGLAVASPTLCSLHGGGGAQGGN